MGFLTIGRCVMPIYEYDGKRPKISDEAFVSETAIIVGDVTIGKNCYIGHGAIIRADYGKVVIGDGTAVEEGAVIHIDPSQTSYIGKMVTIGHGAIVHSRYIGDFAVVGMGAILSIATKVGEWAMVGEGAVVPRGKEVPPGKVALGNPFRIVGDVREDQKKFWEYGKELYVELSKKYRRTFKRL